MKHAEVAALLAERSAEHASKLDLDATMVLAELKKLAFSNILDYVEFLEDGSVRVDLSKVTHDQAAAIAEVYVDEPTASRGAKTKLKLADKLGALRDLGRHLKLFTDRLKVTDLADRVEQLRAGRRRARERRDG